MGNPPDGTEVEAEKYFFGERIENFRKVPGKPHLCLNFNEVVPPIKQELGLYDVQQHRMIWITDIDFAKDCYIPTTLGVVMQSSKNTFLLDDEGTSLGNQRNSCPSMLAKH